MISRCGQAVAHVSHSVLLENEKGLKMIDTYGQSGSTSSESVTLQAYLENRLVQLLNKGGSTLFSLTWKKKATPAGRPYFQLVASVRRISDNGRGSWPTPTKDEAGGTPEQFLARKETERGVRSIIDCAEFGGPAGKLVNAASEQAGIPGCSRQSRSAYWDCDWLPCTDGKARPVEPGTFPLAHGIPGRVGRLRAYGNAIAPQVAAEFIAAAHSALTGDYSK